MKILAKSLPAGLVVKCSKCSITFLLEESDLVNLKHAHEGTIWIDASEYYSCPNPNCRYEIYVASNLKAVVPFAPVQHRFGDLRNSSGHILSTGGSIDGFPKRSPRRYINAIFK